MVYFTNQWKFPEMTFNRHTCNELYPVLKKKNVSPHAPRIVDIKNWHSKTKKKNDLSYIIALMIDLVVTC